MGDLLANLAAPFYGLLDFALDRPLSAAVMASAIAVTVVMLSVA